MDNPSQFQHAWPARLATLALTAGTAWSTFFAWQIAPSGAEPMVALIPALLCLFGAYRFYLTLRSVSVSADQVELIHPWGSRSVRFADVTGIRFDSYPHDLVLKTAHREYRLPRTVQGFRNLHEIVIERTHQAEHEKLPLEVRVRRSVRFAGLAVVTTQAFFSYGLIRQGLGLFSVALAVSVVIAAYAFLDQYILRRCVFQPDGVWVHGMFGRKFYAHSALSDSMVTKSSLWSRLKLQFGSQTVCLEDRVMDLPVIRLARIVEREWGHGVHGSQPQNKAA